MQIKSSINRPRNSSTLQLCRPSTTDHNANHPTSYHSIQPFLLPAPHLKSTLISTAAWWVDGRQPESPISSPVSPPGLVVLVIPGVSPVCEKGGGEQEEAQQGKDWKQFSCGGGCTIICAGFLEQQPRGRQMGVPGGDWLYNLPQLFRPL